MATLLGRLNLFLPLFNSKVGGLLSLRAFASPTRKGPVNWRSLGDPPGKIASSSGVSLGPGLKHPSPLRRHQILRGEPLEFISFPSHQANLLGQKFPEPHHSLPYHLPRPTTTSPLPRVLRFSFLHFALLAPARRFLPFLHLSGTVYSREPGHTSIHQTIYPRPSGSCLPRLARDMLITAT